MNNSFQRLGAKSNAHVGREFEAIAQRHFLQEGTLFTPSFKIAIGVNEIKKNHAFDLGCSKEKILVECKAHKWTTGGNVPSAKITVWNEAMYYFLVAPKEYRKIMFVLRDYNEKRGETLAEFYARTYKHLIPKDVELWEYDEITRSASRIDI